MKGFLAVLFWLWGVVGLLFNAGTLFGLTGNIGVGTSAYLTATCLVWIGTDFDGERPTPDNFGDVRVTE